MTATSPWHHDPDGNWRYGNDPSPYTSPPQPDGAGGWTAPVPRAVVMRAAPMSQPPAPQYRGPSRTAHGPAYWLLVGWWWLPFTKMGRIALWLFVWPLGLWRSIVKGRKDRERRQRRGYR